MHATLSLIRRMLPPALHAQVWIAGSAAIAPRQATDIDVWVLGTPSPDALRQHARDTWDGLARWHDGPNIPTGSPNEDQFSGMGNSEFTRKQIALVGTATPGGQDQPIQVLTIATPTVAELLSSFDLSCHAWATPLVPIRGMLSVPQLHHAAHAYGATLPSELPRVLMFATPADTLGRLSRVLPRYGWHAPVSDHPDYARLALLVSSGAARTVQAA